MIACDPFRASPPAFAEDGRIARGSLLLLGLLLRRPWASAVRLRAGSQGKRRHTNIPWSSASGP